MNLGKSTATGHRVPRPCRPCPGVGRGKLPLGRAKLLLSQKPGPCADGPRRCAPPPCVVEATFRMGKEACPSGRPGRVGRGAASGNGAGRSGARYSVTQGRALRLSGPDGRCVPAGARIRSRARGRLTGANSISRRPRAVRCCVEQAKRALAGYPPHVLELGVAWRPRTAPRGGADAADCHATADLRRPECRQRREEVCMQRAPCRSASRPVARAIKNRALGG